MQDVVLSVSDFVAVLNQTLEYAYPQVVVEGELSNVRVSRGKWVYFDIKDDYASLKCFGTVYQLPGPIEDGMIMRVNGAPRLHPLYNFSLNVSSMMPVGEGSIKKAAQLLEAKLSAEGLFEEARKRPVPFAPENIGLITSTESAAYADFVKILQARWGGVKVVVQNVQVQGEQAVVDVVRAIEMFNRHANPPEVLVITRGGGSAEDLAAFNTEQVTRAVAASRIPTVVAIGHEVDVSLAELAADMRASTPSNAAELLVPDKREVRATLQSTSRELTNSFNRLYKDSIDDLVSTKQLLLRQLADIYDGKRREIDRQSDLLVAYNPYHILKRGYAVVTSGGLIVRSVKDTIPHQDIRIRVSDGEFDAVVR